MGCSCQLMQLVNLHWSQTEEFSISAIIGTSHSQFVDFVICREVLARLLESEVFLGLNRVSCMDSWCHSLTLLVAHCLPQTVLVLMGSSFHWVFPHWLVPTEPWLQAVPGTSGASSKVGMILASLQKMRKSDQSKADWMSGPIYRPFAVFLQIIAIFMNKSSPYQGELQRGHCAQARVPGPTLKAAAATGLHWPICKARQSLDEWMVACWFRQVRAHHQQC